MEAAGEVLKTAPTISKLPDGFLQAKAGVDEAAITNARRVTTANRLLGFISISPYCCSRRLKLTACEIHRGGAGKPTASPPELHHVPSNISEVRPAPGPGSGKESRHMNNRPAGVSMKCSR